MIFTQNVTDDTGGFTERTVIVITVFVHRIDDPAMHRLQTVTDVRQRTGNDNAHRIVEIRTAHFLGNVYRRNIRTTADGIVDNGFFIDFISHFHTLSDFMFLLLPIIANLPD